MINKAFVFTTIFGALFMTISLKLLHVFKFIKWSPVSWTKKLQFIGLNHYSSKWLFLFLGIVVIFAVLYLVISFLDTIPPSISALTFSIIAIFLIEWMIGEPESFIKTVRSISIPLFAVIAIVLRFIAGTAVFMRQLSRKV